MLEMVRGHCCGMIVTTEVEEENVEVEEEAGRSSGVKRGHFFTKV